MDAIDALIKTTVGPVLVACCLSCWTCGIVFSLAGTYWARFTRDRTWIRVSVAVAAVWAMLDTALNCSWAYKWLAMSYYLIFKPKKQIGGLVETSSPIKMIVLKAVQTNALSAICQVCIVALYARWGTALHYTYFGFIETKIYIGSFIATLNTRNPHGNGNFDSSHSKEGRTKGLGAIPSQQPVHVSVRQEIAVDGDEDGDSLGDIKASFPAQGSLAAVSASPYHHVSFEPNTTTTQDVEKGRFQQPGMGGY